MKKWKKLVSAVAFLSFGSLLMGTTALADNTSTNSSNNSSSVSSSDSNSVSSSSDNSSTSSDNNSDSKSDSTDGSITYGATKSVKAGETNIWHSVFTPGNSSSEMKDLTFSDPLDSRLEYVGAKVLQVTKTDSNGNPEAYGADITNEGTLNFNKSTNTVSWTPNKPESFSYAPNNPNSVIDLIVKTKVKNGTKDGSIPNVAVMTLGGQTYKTNDPSINVKTPIGTKLNKQIGKLNKQIGKLAKTGVKLAQDHPIIAIILGALMVSGFGTWGYRVIRARKE